MTILLVIIHIIVSLILIGVVLIQRGKGSEMGAAFGGSSSQTVFGSRGPGNFLSKLTTIAAVIFILTSFSLAFVGSDKGGSSSVIPEQADVPSLPQTQEGPLSQPVPAAPIPQSETAVNPVPAAPVTPGKK